MKTTFAVLLNNDEDQEKFNKVVAWSECETRARMSSSATTTPCRGAMKPALTPTVVVTPSSMSELSPSMMSCSNVSSSLTMSTSKYSSSEPPVLVRTLCLVGRDVQGDKEVVRASDKLGVSVIKSE